MHIAIDALPYNFPAGSAVMLLMVALFLALDALSRAFPKKIKEEAHAQTTYRDPEKQSDDDDEDATLCKVDDLAFFKHADPKTMEPDTPTVASQGEKKSVDPILAPETIPLRFLDPVMALLGPPFDFLLRHSTILFTVPVTMLGAGSGLPRKEVALMTMWFVVSLLLAMIWPIAWIRSTGWIKKKRREARQRKQTELTAGDAQNGPGNEPSADAALRRTQKLLSASHFTRDDHAIYSGHAIEQGRHQGNDRSPGAIQAQFPPEIDMEDAEIAAALEPTADERLAQRLANSFDTAFYLVLALIGLPIYICTSNSVLLFLAVVILIYLFSIKCVPMSMRLVFHPILVTSGLALLALWLLGWMHDQTLVETLLDYSRNHDYSKIIDSTGFHPLAPGAGDIFTSVIDAAVVALALPMYRFRKDIADKFFRIIGALIPFSLLAFFAWPILAYRIGISQVSALTFAPRFLSTGLSVQLAVTIGANEALVTLLVTLTGLTVAMMKDPLFRLLRVPPRDVLTVGVVIGAAGGTIGTTTLLDNPRAMAIGSVSFIMTGLFMLFLGAFPLLTNALHNATGGLFMYEHGSAAAVVVN